MKQKVVIQVSMHDQESRRKAMKIVVGCSGVLSAALKGDDLRKIEITGDGVDVTSLTKLMRKKVGHAELVSVGPLDDKKESEDETTVVEPQQQFWRYGYVVYHQDRNPAPGCSMM